MAKTNFPRAVLFDLLTALLNSWTVWNAAAGSEAAGGAWRAEYLRLTYGCGAYVPYEQLVRPPRAPRPPRHRGRRPGGRWNELAAWNGAQSCSTLCRAEPSWRSSPTVRNDWACWPPPG